MEKIVIVEDDDNIREAFRYFMPSHFEVKTAKNGKEGLDLILKEKSLYAIITDFNMPVMTGLELIIEVMNHKIPVTKIIVMSGNSTNFPLIDKLNKDYGNIQFLEKPFSPDDLISLIED
jgi:DNA-binding NtrC family response regulator